MAPEAVFLIQETRPGGRFGFYWNVRLQDLKMGSSNTILGYEAAGPAAQGIVLMGDGSVRQMSQAEFDSTPKPASR
jgi:hypothetical protein